MKLVVLRCFKGQMNHPEAQKSWLDLIEMRQRVYEGGCPQALILDKYDLIADHLLLYSDQTKAPMAYLRVITREICDQFQQQFPLAQIVDLFPDQYKSAYHSFMEQKEKMPVHMSYLCLDLKYRQELRGTGATDLLTWLGFKVTGLSRHQLSFCGTPNVKRRIGGWLDQIGEKVPDLEPFVHPVVPDPHQVVLIPELSEKYWQERAFRFGQIWKNMIWIAPSESQVAEAA